MIGTGLAISPMSPEAVIPGEEERRILILAPTGIDAPLTAEFLASAGMLPQICADVPELCREIRRGCGAIVLAEEILCNKSIEALVSLLAEQPSWSDIPLVLVTSGGDASQMQLRRLSIFGPSGNVTLLERPFRPRTLISALEVALRARQRQYEARDFVEELKRARDEAQMASQAKDAFLAALSHELRTPLNPALLIASEFACDQQLPEEVRQNFEIILKNIELEARLIDDLLDLTRVTTGKMVLRREDVNIHTILTEALDKVRAEVQRKEIRLDLELNATQSVINGDAVRLQQVFWNILTNAVKFTPQNGKIRIETSMVQKNHPDLQVRITDSGIGMTSEEAARVFQAFVQGDHANGGGSHRFGGLGLGLAISKNLVHLHSGTIAVESAGRNLGTTFAVTLPLASRAQS
jgi:signal transduction histidine kinase